jgi:transcriptional regulator with XRE-family HTH domain
MSDKKTRAQILGENLKRIRTEKGFTRKKVATDIGITETAYGTYERGERKLDVETIFKLAVSLNVKIADIVGENPYAQDNKIFDYRLHKAFEMARDFIDQLFNEKPHFDDEGRIIYSPKKIKTNDDGTICYYGGYNSVTFKTAEDFIKVMEQAENDALKQQIHFNLAFRHIIWGDEFYRVIDK